jgi:hypothetical protein
MKPSIQDYLIAGKARSIKDNVRSLLGVTAFCKQLG